MLLHPGDEGSARELGPVVATPRLRLWLVFRLHGARIATEEAVRSRRHTTQAPLMAWSTVISIHSCVHSVMVRLPRRRPLANSSLTKSILQAALGAVARDSGRRSPGGQRILLWLRTARFASRYSR